MMISALIAVWCSLGFILGGEEKNHLLSLKNFANLYFIGSDARNVQERGPDVTLPNVKLIDCAEAGLTAKICLKIKFEHGSGNALIEYAGLKEEEPGIETILSGPLFTSELVELENSRVSVTLLEEDQDAQV